MPARSFPLAVPRLVGRLRLQDIPGLEPETGEAVRKAWDDAMFELQRFLGSLQVSADVTQDTLTEIEDAMTDGRDDLSSRRPTPHMHHLLDIVGGGGATPGAELEPRRATVHTHHVHDVSGLIGDTHVILVGQVFGP